MYGNRKGRQAADLWHHLLLQIENAYSTNQPISGISADIEKCFNCIPRFPALCLAVLAGAPHAVTTAWAGGLAQMRRHFKVRESFSAGFLTSTGLAEGCGLSVYGMLLVDHLFHCWISYQAAPVRSLSYVDDWHVFAWDPTFAVRQLELVVEFAGLLDLTIDRKKTVAWSTNADVRQTLREHGVQVVHHARELGGHFGVSRQFTNRTVTQRLAALEDFWPKLRASKARYKAKVYMLRAVAWPRGLHAVASAPLGDHIWTELRRRTKSALALQKPGVNAHVLLGLVEPWTDPQLVALSWTCRTARANCDMDFWTSSVACVAHGELDLPPNTVASILLSRLQQVGFEVDRWGQVHDRFGCFSLANCNYAELELRLQWAWTQVVAAKVSHRTDFAGIWQVDVAFTRSLLSELPPDDQALLRFGLVGGLFTESYKSKWTPQSDQCRWCGQTDTLAHRYWQCCQHTDLRAELAPDATPVWESIPPALSLRGWALLPPTWQRWISLLAALPSQVLAPSRNLVPGQWNDVFTDGSCMWQSEPMYRVAAWSAVLAPSAQSSWTPEATAVLCASVLPGVCQSAFRAELFAVAYVVHWASVYGAPVRIWSDCLGVVNKLHLLCKNKLKQGVNRPNSDLWTWLAVSVDALGSENLQVKKVEAHRTLQSARNAAEVWKFFHNGYADKAAKTANQARSEAFWQFWEEHVQATERARRLAQQVTALQLAIGKRHVRAQNDITDVIEQGPRVTREFVPCFAFGNWTGQMVPNAARLFGTAHVTRAMRWLEARLVTDDTAEPQWLSFTQFYLDYQMTWSNPGPLRVQQQWVDLSSRPYLTVATIPFRTRVRWFRQFLKAIWKEGGLQATMDQCRPASQMIQAYVPCFALPWAKHAVQIVDSWLGQELTAPCTRAAGALKALPVPKQCPELRLLDP